MAAKKATRRTATTKRPAAKKRTGKSGGARSPARTEGSQRARLEAQHAHLGEMADDAIQRAREVASKAQARVAEELKELEKHKKQLQKRLDRMRKTADEDLVAIRAEVEQAGEHLKNALETVVERVRKLAVAGLDGEKEGRAAGKRKRTTNKDKSS